CPFGAGVYLILERAALRPAPKGFMVRLPLATYRVQFNKDFDFDAAGRIIPYLHDLGISDLYASPIFKARAGSTHGYDVVDHNVPNPELGSQEALENLSREIRSRSMGW